MLGFDLNDVSKTGPCSLQNTYRVERQTQIEKEQSDISNEGKLRLK